MKLEGGPYFVIFGHLWRLESLLAGMLDKVTLSLTATTFHLWYLIEKKLVHY